MKNLNTKVLPAGPGTDLKPGAQLLLEGGLVAFPTETVYGLGANALNPDAVARIFRAKGRPSDNPLIVHIADMEQVYELSGDIPVHARRAMEAFWPGPLTVVLHKKREVPDIVTAGLDTVAIRMPDHPVALELIRLAGVPVAAPSANTSGKPSPTTAGHVLEDMDGRIDMVVDGGACRVGLESTVLDLTAEPPVILRPGGVTREDIEGVIGHVEVDPALGKLNEDFVPKSPGMKYTHYSPRADVIVVSGQDFGRIFEKVSELARQYRLSNKRVGVLASSETGRGYSADAVFPAGSRGNLETVAQNLFYGLRFLDDKGVDLIIAEGYPEEGIGLAIMNRLRKAAGNNVIHV